MLSQELINEHMAVRELDLIKTKVLDDLFEFFIFFYNVLYRKPPEIPQPVGRVNHLRQIANELMKAARGEFQEPVLTINIPSRYGKTLMMIMWMAWCYAHEPAANFIYVSHSKSLATEQTAILRQLIGIDIYQVMFDVRISRDIGAKNNFKTIQGGQTVAVGVDGSGIGKGAGIHGNIIYGGALILDDVFKTSDAFSNAAKTNFSHVYSQTLVNRRNNPNMTPLINMGQRLAQDDPTGMLHEGYKGKSLDIYQHEWNKNALIIPAVDDAGNVLWPSKHSKEYLAKLKDEDAWTYYSVFQQKPISAGNAIFKVDRIKLLKEEPKIISTFITVDTAETVDTVNDASVFSMWGVYELEFAGEKSGLIGLHWMVCHECYVSPEDLEDEFESFYISCMRQSVAPSRVFIEKKSTGVSLIANMKNKPGIVVVDIPRTAADGSKSNRFALTAPFIAKGQLSIMRDAYHRQKCIAHMEKITFDGSQKNDDIADTYADAAKLVFIDKAIYNVDNKNSDTSQAVKKVEEMNRQRRLAYSNRSTRI